MDLKEWFCLNRRQSFTIDPKVNPDDAKFYFGRYEIIKQVNEQLRRSFIDPQTPKMIVFGPYGCGKTQLLYHLTYLLTNMPPVTLKMKAHIVYFNIEMKSKSDHRHWHLQMMEALGKDVVTKWVQNIANKSSNIEEELHNIFNDTNVAEATRKLLIGGLEFMAWRWLCGRELSQRELEQLKVTRNLGYIGASDMVRTLISIGRLAENNNKKIIFMIDEAERFSAVKAGDETQYLIDYLRELSEKSNMSVGFVIAGTAGAFDELPALFLSEAVVRRIGKNNYINVPPLDSIKDVKNFLNELLKGLVDQDEARKCIKEHSLPSSLGIYPFDNDSFEQLCKYATEDPAKSLPSHLIHCLNECAISAWSQEKRIIDLDIVNEIAPNIFG